ncbi:MAG: DNA recombination protein RmuC [Rhodomicrobium sp.]
MSAELVSGIAAATALAAFATALLIFLRSKRGADSPDVLAKLQSLADSVARLESILRDEGGRNREEAGAASRSLREELANEVRALLQLVDNKLSDLGKNAADSDRALREEVQGSVKVLGDNIAAAQKEKLELVAKELSGLTHKQEQTQENLRKSVEQRLDILRGENSEKLEKIRKTVDEQLQGTLEKRLGESFKLVSERLEQVHRGLGEMQSLANGVGDLKRVLTNVKARGAWGEVQLGNLLEQVLTPEQYLKNAATRPGSQERVEYAIRLPGREDGEPEVLLPIDAKFPQEDYDRLTLAAERGDPGAVDAACKQLEARVRNSAREIRDKYVNPPHTTDFAIMFMPTEGLYAEVLRRPGLIEMARRDYRVTLAGPTTLAATLNALQMGFRTLAIQKRSSEVWRVLEAVKAEFGKYGTMLDQVQKKLHEASNTIEKVTARQRAVDRKLRAVESISDGEAEAILGLTPVALEDWREQETV